jgi:hypothetical protein
MGGRHADDADGPSRFDLHHPHASSARDIPPSARLRSRFDHPISYALLFVRPALLPTVGRLSALHKRGSTTDRYRRSSTCWTAYAQAVCAQGRLRRRRRKGEWADDCEWSGGWRSNGSLGYSEPFWRASVPILLARRMQESRLSIQPRHRTCCQSLSFRFSHPSLRLQPVR